MNGLWMKSGAVVAVMMGLSALATAGAPARVRPSRVVGPARAWTRVGVWDDTDISHVARPNALRAQLTPIRDGTSNTIVDGTSNTLKAQARPSRLHDDSVGAGIASLGETRKRFLVPFCHDKRPLKAQPTEVLAPTGLAPVGR